MYSSKYNESLMISVDAFGDFKSCEVYYLCKDEIKLIDSVYFPNSLGVFYSAMTQFVGLMIMVTNINLWAYPHTANMK